MDNREIVKRTVIYEGLFIFEIDEYDEYPSATQRTAPLNNEGYSVELIPREWSWGNSGSKFDDFCSLFAAEEYHLTLSVSEDGRPVDTGKLKFSALPINRRKVYECRFGAFVENQFSDGSKDTEYVFNRS